VKPIYDDIEQFDIYKKGWAKVKLKGKFGFIDKRGVEVVRTIYDEIGQFDVEKVDWAKVKINNRVSFIDKDGTDVIEARQ
jgi:hypothetical protein